jgi:hypothetical protein
MEVTVKGKKQAKGRWNFLIMRSQGVVTNFSVSPFLLAVVLLFALVFAVISVVVMNQYFNLYLEHRKLVESRREDLARLDQLDIQQQYHIALTQDYAELLAELNQSGLESEENGDAQEISQDDAAETEAVMIEVEEEDPLSAWAARLPDLAGGGSGETLNVIDFKAESSRFSFQLINDAAGTMARGRLLTLFLVEAGGRRQVVPFPDFDPRSPRPNFESGPGYNIRSSKHISGQLRIPVGSKILAAMVAARANDGRMVMKKLVQP